MNDDITVTTTHKFTLAQLELLLEAVSIYSDFGRRGRTALFDSKNRMFSKKRLAELKDTQDLFDMLGNGDAQIKWVPIGPKFSEEDNQIIDNLHDMFLEGMGAVEEKIEEHNTKVAEENIDSVVDGLYEMLRSDNEQ
jgi:aspartyl-tRNA synthetase